MVALYIILIKILQEENWIQTQYHEGRWGLAHTHTNVDQLNHNKLKVKVSIIGDAKQTLTENRIIKLNKKKTTK